MQMRLKPEFSFPLSERGTKGVENVQVRKFLIASLVLGSLSIYGGYAFGQTYYVQPGDSIYKIATRYGTSVNALLSANNLGLNSEIYPGQALQIGFQSAGAVNRTHVVQTGESLYLIAQRYQISVDELLRANNLSDSTLVAGQRLTIPAANSSSTGSDYTVKSGDSLYLIAKRYGILLSELLNANNLTDSSEIRPGQVLQLPQSNGSTPTDTGSTSTFSQNDVALLARLVSAESAGEPFSGQVAVAATILNRLKDPRYPKTIPGIIYQIDSGRYQYSPVLDGRINQPATASAFQAVQLAISGWDPSNGANGFYNPAKTSSAWVRSNPVTATIGDHVFFAY